MSVVIPAGGISQVGVPPGADLPVRIEYKDVNGDWRVYGTIEHRGDTLTVSGPAEIRGVNASTKCGEGAVCPQPVVEVDIAVCSTCGGGGPTPPPPVTPRCIAFRGFDWVSNEEFTEETPAQFTIVEDGVVQATITVDYLAAAGTTKSSWYAPVVAAVNALGGGHRWNMTLLTDVNATDEGRVQWLLTYTDAGDHTLEIVYDSGLQSHIFHGNGSNDIGASVVSEGAPAADFGTPQFEPRDC